jgi:RHS repeat-associated protein
MTTPFVEYAYANGSGNTVRPTGTIYPDGRELSLDYGSGGSMADALSRVGSILDDDNTHLTDYSYLGERSFVVNDYTQPDVKWTLASLTGTNDPDTGDTYTGLDRFGRVKDNRWYDYGAAADADRIKYGYDRAGNRTWRQNTVADAQGKHFDELYGNDLIHRLKELARGTLNANKNGVTSKSFAECWSLDPTGNWKKFLEDTNGDGVWNLDQARTSNPVNEITGITESAGPSWATPAYSAAGNMTTIPQPGDPPKTYTATYDAWNRLVKVVDDDTDDTVAEYQYDGANRRIVQKSYDEGDLDETRHLYYTQPSQWQVVEERVDAETDPDRQFVWGLRYIDDLILRDRDTNGDGSLNERLYALQDANWNLTGLIDTAGDVQERNAYSAYGTPLFLTPSFGGRVSSSFDWETLYAGYRWETLTELFHVRHRVLNTVLGTWCQRDPLGYTDTPSLYEYLGSLPLIAVGFTGTRVMIPGAPISPAPNAPTVPGRLPRLPRIPRIPRFPPIPRVPLPPAHPVAVVVVAVIVVAGVVLYCLSTGGCFPPDCLPRQPRVRRKRRQRCRHPDVCDGTPRPHPIASTFLTGSCGDAYRLKECHRIDYVPGRSCNPPGNGVVYHCTIETRNGAKVPRYEVSVVCCNCCRQNKESQDCDAPHWSSNSNGDPPPGCV